MRRRGAACRSGGLKWSSLRLNLHSILVQFWTIHHSLALLRCSPLGPAPWSDRFFFKGISTFLPRGLLCCCLSLSLNLRPLQMGSLLPSTSQFLNLSANCYRGPLTKSSYFCGPLSQKWLTSLTPEAKLALIFTKNYTGFLRWNSKYFRRWQYGLFPVNKFI
jgi:hypothetical protein